MENFKILFKTFRAKNLAEYLNLTKLLARSCGKKRLLGPAAFAGVLIYSIVLIFCYKTNCKYHKSLFLMISFSF